MAKPFLSSDFPGHGAFALATQNEAPSWRLSSGDEAAAPRTAEGTSPGQPGFPPLHRWRTRGSQLPGGPDTHSPANSRSLSGQGVPIPLRDSRCRRDSGRPSGESAEGAGRARRPPEPRAGRGVGRGGAQLPRAQAEENARPARGGVRGHAGPPRAGSRAAALRDGKRRAWRVSGAQGRGA